MINTDDTLTVENIVSAISSLRDEKGILRYDEIFVNLPKDLSSNVFNSSDQNWVEKKIIEECNIYTGDLANGLFLDSSDSDILVSIHPF